MKTVTVNTPKPYDVIIGRGILPTLGQHMLRVCKAETVAVISDSNVWPFYGKAVVDSLRGAGLEVCSFLFPAGEASKNGQTYLSLLNFLAEHRLTRTDALVALGGGVVGDLTGFAAATYLRGISCVQVPTTLLAAVDSSIGGKTAIDLPAGKNLAGAFCQPCLVLCDTDTLNTLPEDIFRDGCAEVIKYGVLYDPQLFSHLALHGIAFHREDVISRCVELKRDVVMEDEFDTGARMKLNLGHTIGHGVEASSGFAISHGKAVAIGMAIVARAAAKRGDLSEADKNALLDILTAFCLPTATDFTSGQLYRCALSDKKRSGGKVNLIVPRAIGRCDIVPVEVENLKFFIEAGL